MLENISCKNTASDFSLNYDEREQINKELFKRDMKADMKIGIDAIFAFKEKLEQLHPHAKDALLRLIRQHH